MMVSILVHGLCKAPLASALGREPLDDVESVMEMAQNYINEEEMNLFKDQEWTSTLKKIVDKSPCDRHQRRSEMERAREPDFLRLPRFDKYTPLNVSGLRL